MKLAPYPFYKSLNGVAVKRAPEHWDTVRCKYLFREKDIRSTDGKETHLSMSQKYGLVDTSKVDKWRLQSESYDGGKRCSKGDLVLNRLKAHLGVFAHAKQAGVVSPDYTVLKPVSGDNPKYFEVLFKTPEYISEFAKYTKGIVEGFWRLYTDDFYAIRVHVPPIDEQKQILHFTDSFLFNINKFIRNKRRLIELLTEMRLVLTCNATKSNQTKWLRFGVVSERKERSVKRERDHVYTPIGLFNRGRGIFHKEPTQGKNLGDSTFYWVKPGDLVFSGQFAWEGAVAIARPTDAGCIASHRYPIFKNKPDVVDAAYLYSFFTTKHGDMLLNLHSRGAAGRNRPLNPRTLAKEKIPVPPLNLQKQISEIFKVELKVRLGIASQISLLREYRTRLISDVVTGKVDVRGIELSDVPEDELLEPEEDETATDELIEDGGSMDDAD